MGKCLRPQLMAHLNRFAVSVYPHLTEVKAEAILHETAHSAGQRATVAIASFQARLNFSGFACVCLTVPRGSNTHRYIDYLVGLPLATV
jgi:hypothetical protein